MTDRTRLFDNLAGVAGNMLSVAAGLCEEIDQLVQTRLDETLRRLRLVRIEELEAVQALAAAARLDRERAEARLTAVEARLAALEAPHG